MVAYMDSGSPLRSARNDQKIGFPQESKSLSPYFGLSYGPDIQL